MEGQTSCPGLPPDSPSLGGQAANWDSMMMLELELEPPVMKEVSMETAKSHQRTEMRMGSTSPAVKKIQTPASAVLRRSSVWQP